VPAPKRTPFCFGGPRRSCVAPLGRVSASASGWAAVGGQAVLNVRPLASASLSLPDTLSLAPHPHAFGEARSGFRLLRIRVPARAKNKTKDTADIAQSNRRRRPRTRTPHRFATRSSGSFRTLMRGTHTSRVSLRLRQCAAIAVCRLPPSKTPASSAQNRNRRFGCTGAAPGGARSGKRGWCSPLTRRRRRRRHRVRVKVARHSARTAASLPAPQKRRSESGPQPPTPRLRRSRGAAGQFAASVRRRRRKLAANCLSRRPRAPRRA